MVLTTTPRSCQSLPAETWYGIHSHLPDLLTLSNLLSAHPFLNDLVVARHPEIFACLFKKASFSQVSRIASAIFVLRHSRLPLSQFHWHFNLDILFEMILPSGRNRFNIFIISNPVAALHSIAELYKNTEYFFYCFISLHCKRPVVNNPGLLSSMENPPLPTEMHRLQRALWRFWLLHEIVYGMNVNRETATSIEWRRTQWRRNPACAARDLFSHYSPWEIEELECVRFFFENLYTRFRSPLPVVPKDTDQAGHPSPQVRDEIYIVRRLLYALGYSPTSECPTSPDQLHCFDASFIYGNWSGNRVRSASRDVPPGANFPNEGWSCCHRNGLYPTRNGVDRWPAVQFHRWGYCI